MQKTERGRSLIYVWILIGVMVLLVGGFFLWRAGYTVNSGGITHGGTLSIAVPVEGAQIYLGDQEEEGRASKGEVTLRGLSPSVYQVIVAKDGYWPWTKTLLIKGGETTRASAFLLPKEIRPEVLGQDDPEFEAITELLNTSKNTADSRKTSKDERVSLWLQGTQLLARWNGSPADDAPEYFCNRGGCTNPIEVFVSNSPITTFDFYPGRADVVLFATGSQIFAVEFDRRGIQNFQPLYQGESPAFAVAKSGNVFIEDKGQVFQINLP